MSVSGFSSLCGADPPETLLHTQAGLRSMQNMLTVIANALKGGAKINVGIIMCLL